MKKIIFSRASFWMVAFVLVCSGISFAQTFDHLSITPISTQTAGTPFTIRAIWAADTNDLEVPGFTGTVNITSTGTLSAGGGTSPAFLGGVLWDHSVTFSNAGTFTITATSMDGLETVTSNSFIVMSPSAAAKYLVGLPFAIPGNASYTSAGISIPITAQLSDVNNNPVKTAGKVVTWSKSDANGSFAASTSTTDANGIATVVFTPHAVLGTSTTITCIDRSSFTGTSGTITTTQATNIALRSANNQSGPINSYLTSSPFHVEVLDGSSHSVSGVIETFSAATAPPGATGQSVGTVSVATNVYGRAQTFAGLGNKVGTYTYNASVTGLTGSPVILTATATPGPATHYNVTSSSINPSAGSNVTITAQLADVGDNAVSTAGNVVTWSKTNANGSFAAPTSTANAGGIATVVFTTHTVAGTSTTVTGTTGSLTGTSTSITTIVRPMRLSLKVFLQGPYNTGTGSMNTALRSGGYLASHFGSIPIPASAVDSINIEIRDSASAAQATVRRYATAWLLSDGTVRSFSDTTKTFAELEATIGSYYIVVRHRNHLAIMSAARIVFAIDSAGYDFTTAQTQVYNSAALPMIALDGVNFGMWAGDANSDGVVKYNLSSNDRLLIYNRIGNAGLNVTVNGYYPEDLNLDGTVKYNLTNNDRLLIYNVIGNGGLNVTRSTQVPN